MIAFTWLYHGLVPKILHIAPLEIQMTGSAGFSPEITYWIVKGAGIGEVIWALIFWLFYRSKAVLYLNILGLVGLLLAVAIMQPQLLFEAFNPVTTNLPLIVASVIILIEQKRKVEAG